MNLRGRNKVSAEFNMSSMTDIVFLLLIFFMIASTTIVSNNALDLVLPKSSGKSEEIKNVSVSVNNKLEYFIDKDKFAENTLEEKLKTMLENQTDPTILLHVEEGVPIERAVSVMDIAYRNKFKVVLAVSPK
ncbi:biopolymer transporter ExbD [Flavobacterium sp. RSP49]|uniref:ExbD/TolR family protein n=1 Tax=Flavobacterium sp. RSP49 TaxID=2497487 RepID=UPI000F81ABE6|nr:biopolymer transporter ExbD [Flavobacterium sp. RSP49]RTZ02788.1 biopolymer transporter ExbD [Flavobacterium sp. RSP49]